MDLELRQSLAALTPRLRRFGLALTGSMVDADDLVQCACVRALERSGQLRELNRLDGWVYAIMRHLWLDEVRARRVRQHDDLDSANAMMGVDGEVEAIERMSLAEVRRAVRSLSVDCRSVLVLVCVDGLTYREAAQVLGVPVGTVMSRLSRVRRALHVRLSRKEAADGVVPLKLPAGRGQPRPA